MVSLVLFNILNNFPSLLIKRMGNSSLYRHTFPYLSMKGMSLISLKIINCFPRKKKKLLGVRWKTSPAEYERLMLEL